MSEGSELTPAPTRSIARRSAAAAARAQAPRRSWRRGVLGAFAGFAAFGFVAAYMVPLTSTTASAHASEIEPISLYANSIADAQAYIAASDADPDAETASLGREDMTYSVYVTPKPTPTPTSKGSSASSSWTPAFVNPDPGSAQAIAYEQVLSRGWDDAEFACLVALWKKESGWRVNAYNKSSGAYGIPQALPGRKMASAGSDWETNPATQITWGLGYISSRYGTPCGAWGHSQNKGWY